MVDECGVFNLLGSNQENLWATNMPERNLLPSDPWTLELEGFWLDFLEGRNLDSLSLPA